MAELLSQYTKKREFNMKTAVYPGSFDPPTNGHLDIIKRAAKIYDHIVVGVLDNLNKKPLFTAQERAEMLKTAAADIPNVSVDIFDGLLVDFVKLKGADVVVKGLRTVADFEYEFQMALLNKALDSNCETVFMMTDTKYSYISSSMVKDVAKLSGDLTGLVPSGIIESVKNKCKILR